MTAPEPAPNPDQVIVQMNVRLPKSLRDAIDVRRAKKDMSRDKWVANALRFALDQHTAPVRTLPGQRTAPPPRQR